MKASYGLRVKTSCYQSDGTDTCSGWWWNQSNQPRIIFLELGLPRPLLLSLCIWNHFCTFMSFRSKRTPPPPSPSFSSRPSPASVFQIQNKHQASLVRHFQGHQQRFGAECSFGFLQALSAPVACRNDLAPFGPGLKLSWCETWSYHVSVLRSACLHWALFCTCGVFKGSCVTLVLWINLMVFGVSLGECTSMLLHPHNAPLTSCCPLLHREGKLLREGNSEVWEESCLHSCWRWCGRGARLKKGKRS